MRTPIQPLAATLALAACAGAVVAQDAAQPFDGPVVVGEPRERFRGFVLHRLDAGLSFSTQYRHDERKPVSGPKIELTETRFREAVDLSTRFFLGHENLVDVHAFGSFGLEQQDIESDEQGAADENDTTNLYDVSALILGQGPAPLTLYSRRDQTLLDREFGGSIDTTTTEHGASVLLFSRSAPTLIRYFQREQDQSDLLGDADFNLKQETLSLRTDANLTDHQRLSVDYAYDDVREVLPFGSRNDYERHDGTLTHTLDFGGDAQHNLRSNANVFSQHGSTDQERLRLDEQMLLRHSDTFETRYDLTLEDLSVNEQEQRLARGSALARHRLFESLVTTGTVGYRRAEIPGDFTSEQTFGDLDFDYTKRVPWGRLDAAVGGAIAQESNSERGSPINVLDDAFTFNDPFPITISRRNIVPGSIVVTDAANLIPFTEGLDYTTAVFPDRAEIRRIVGGAISDGETVLIDYEIGPEPASDIDTFGARLAARYTFEDGWLTGLSPYVSYHQVDHSLSTADPSRIVLDDFRDLIYGADYFIGHFTLTAERQDHDSEVQPYDATRLSARYQRPLGLGSTLTLSATRTHIDYSLENNEVELNRLDGLWNQRWTDSLDSTLRLTLRDEHDSFVGDTLGFEQGLELRWRKRQLDLFIAIENSFLEADNEDSTFQTLTFGFRRAF